MQVMVPSDPAGRFKAVGIRGGLPDFRGAKVGPVGIRITHPVHQGDLAVIEKPFQTGEILVEPHIIIDR